MFDDILKFASPILSVIITSLIYRIFRVEKDYTRIKAIIDLIIDLILEVEKTNNRNLSSKKAEVSRMINYNFKDKDKRLVIKNFGSIDNAVSICFNKVLKNNLQTV